MKTPRIADAALVLLAAIILSPAAHADPFERLEARIEEAGKTVEDIAYIPNLKIDTRRRDLKLDILRVRSDGGLTFDVESRSHLGGLPSASAVLADHGLAASLRTEASHDLKRVTFGGSWSFRAATLTGTVDRSGRCEAGLSVRLLKSQSLDYTLRSGPAADHRVGWNLRIAL